MWLTYWKSAPFKQSILGIHWKILQTPGTHKKHVQIRCVGGRRDFGKSDFTNIMFAVSLRLKQYMCGH